MTDSATPEQGVFYDRNPPCPKSLLRKSPCRKGDE
jgi:hypothetical protein